LRFDEEPRLALLLLEAEAPDGWEDIGVPDSPNPKVSTKSRLSDGCLNRGYVHACVRTLTRWSEGKLCFGHPSLCLGSWRCCPLGAARALNDDSSARALQVLAESQDRR